MYFFEMLPQRQRVRRCGNVQVSGWSSSLLNSCSWPCWLLMSTCMPSSSSRSCFTSTCMFPDRVFRPIPRRPSHLNKDGLFNCLFNTEGGQTIPMNPTDFPTTYTQFMTLLALEESADS